LKLIVGLGNPGRRYAATRHNVGFLVVDELARRHGISVRKRMGRALAGEGRICEQDVILAKPQTFMNLSGEAVSHIARRRSIGAEDLIVIYDDVDLPPGKLRIRARGSSGGHKGMKSVIQHLGTEEFPRVRIGIGSIEGEAVDYVLSRFRRSEVPLIRSAVREAAAAVEVILSEGIEAAMNRFN